MNTLRDALFAPESVAIVGQSNDFTKTAGRPLKFLLQMGYAGPHLSHQSGPADGAGPARLADARVAAGAARPRLYRHADRRRDRSGGGMRQARRQGRDRARRRLHRGRRMGRHAGGAAARHLRDHRHPGGRAVEPRHRRSAHPRDAHRQCRLRRGGAAGGPHLRGFAFRQHDRFAAVARQGARDRLRRPGVGRQRGRSLARRDLRSDPR